MHHQIHEEVTASVLIFPRILPVVSNDKSAHLSACLPRLEAMAILETLVVNLGALSLMSYPSDLLRICSKNCHEQGRLSLRIPSISKGERWPNFVFGFVTSPALTCQTASLCPG